MVRTCTCSEWAEILNVNYDDKCGRYTSKGNFQLYNLHPTKYLPLKAVKWNQLQ